MVEAEIVLKVSRNNIISMIVTVRFAKTNFLVQFHISRCFLEIIFYNDVQTGLVC